MRFVTTLSSLMLVAATALASAQTPAPTAAQPSTPIRIGGQTKPPERIKYVAPVYPAALAAMRVSGIVIIEATVGTDGTVTDAKVVRSIEGLDQPALTAVRQWKYTPTTLNGKPVPVIMTVTVNFTPPGTPAAAEPSSGEMQSAVRVRDPEVDYSDANVKITIAVIDKDSAAPQTKTATMIVGNRENGRLRSNNRSSASINADANAELRRSGLVKVFLNLTYEPASDKDTPPFQVTQSATLFLKDGVPMVIVQAADPTKNGRSVTIEVTANVIR